MDESKSKSTKKKTRKGQKASRGKPLFYSEKKERINVMLTPTAKSILKRLASGANKSVSEWLEIHLRMIGGEVS